jgi:hypothetical protein
MMGAFLTLSTLLSACNASSPKPAGPAAPRIAERTKEQKAELGRQHKTAADLYQALRDEAKVASPCRRRPFQIGPGVYSRPADKGFTFDPDQPDGGLPTARLTPEYQKKLLKRIEDVKHGIEWDPISTVLRRNAPLADEPFLREFIVSPDQTWLINEW